MYTEKNTFIPDPFFKRLDLFINSIKSGKNNFKICPGLSKQSRSSYKNRKTLPNAKTFFAWSSTFNLSIDWLLTGRGEMFILDKPSEHCSTSIDTNKEQFDKLVNSRNWEVDLLRQEIIDLHRELNLAQKELVAIYKEKSKGD